MQSEEVTLNSVLEPYAGTRVLVLGASGFIGRSVARLLTRAGADLYLPARDCAAAKRIFVEYGIEGNIYKIDLRDSEALRRLLREMSPAITFNLAGYGVDRNERSVEPATRINSLLPEIVCTTVAETKGDIAWRGQRVVHVGTAMEYGAVTGDLREDSPTRPTTLYGRSKLAGTEAVTSFCCRNNFPGVTARLFAVYGPGEARERLLPTLIAASHNTRPIELTAGLHKRDFTYVEDAAEAMLRLGISECAPGEVVNVATGILTSIRSFVEAAAARLDITNDRLTFGAIETRPEEMSHDPVNVGNLHRITGWRPRFDVSEGIQRTVDFNLRREVHLMRPPVLQAA